MIIGEYFGLSFNLGAHVMMNVTGVLVSSLDGLAVEKLASCMSASCGVVAELI